MTADLRTVTASVGCPHDPDSELQPSAWMGRITLLLEALAPAALASFRGGVCENLYVEHSTDGAVRTTTVTAEGRPA